MNNYMSEFNKKQMMITVVVSILLFQFADYLWNTYSKIISTSNFLGQLIFIIVYILGLFLIGFVLLEIFLAIFKVKNVNNN